MFELEEIEFLYAEMIRDSEFDRELIVNYALNLSAVHSKWNHKLTLYRMEQIKLESIYDRVLNTKRIYYSGKANSAIYSKNPMPSEYRGIKLTKAEIDIIINSDEDVINAREDFEMAKTICESITHFMYQLSRNTKLVEIVHSSEKYDLMGA